MIFTLCSPLKSDVLCADVLHKGKFCFREFIITAIVRLVGTAPLCIEISKQKFYFAVNIIANVSCGDSEQIVQIFFELNIVILCTYVYTHVLVYLSVHVHVAFKGINKCTYNVSPSWL